MPDAILSNNYYPGSLQTTPFPFLEQPKVPSKEEALETVNKNVEDLTSALNDLDKDPSIHITSQYKNMVLNEYVQLFKKYADCYAKFEDPNNNPDLQELFDKITDLTNLVANLRETKPQKRNYSRLLSTSNGLKLDPKHNPEYFKGIHSQPTENKRPTITTTNASTNTAESPQESKASALLKTVIENPTILTDTVYHIPEHIYDFKRKDQQPSAEETALAPALANPQQLAANPQQLAANPQQLAANPQQLAANPQQLAGGPPPPPNVNGGPPPPPPPNGLPPPPPPPDVNGWTPPPGAVNIFGGAGFAEALRAQRNGLNNADQDQQADGAAGPNNAAPANMVDELNALFARSRGNNRNINLNINANNGADNQINHLGLRPAQDRPEIQRPETDQERAARELREAFAARNRQVNGFAADDPEALNPQQLAQAQANQQIQALGAQADLMRAQIAQQQVDDSDNDWSDDEDDPIIGMRAEQPEPEGD